MVHHRLLKKLRISFQLYQTFGLLKNGKLLRFLTKKIGTVFNIICWYGCQAGYQRFICQLLTDVMLGCGFTRRNGASREYVRREWLWVWLWVCCIIWWNGCRAGFRSLTPKMRQSSLKNGMPPDE